MQSVLGLACMLMVVAAKFVPKGMAQGRSRLLILGVLAQREPDPIGKVGGACSSLLVPG